MIIVARYAEHGAPEKVVFPETEPLREPGAGEVLFDHVVAPINPADLNAIQGVYATLPPLPATPGVEGVATIRAVGPGVPEEFAPGKRVILPHGYGTWREAGTLPAEKLVPVPDDIPYLTAAMLKINPATAWHMLHRFVPLKPGDWVALNAANSAVGRLVIALAREMQVRTLCFVRRPELTEGLMLAGATAVFPDTADGTDVAKKMLGNTPLRLALNAVGGESALRLGSLLSPQGIHVTYGAMSGQALKIPASHLIFKDLQYRGFWVSRWYLSAPAEEVQAMYTELFRLARKGVFQIPVARVYPVTEVKEGILHAMQGGRSGKVLLGTPPAG